MEWKFISTPKKKLFSPSYLEWSTQGGKIGLKSFTTVLESLFSDGLTLNISTAGAAILEQNEKETHHIKVLRWGKLDAHNRNISSSSSMLDGRSWLFIVVSGVKFLWETTTIIMFKESSLGLVSFFRYMRLFFTVVVVVSFLNEQME